MDEDERAALLDRVNSQSATVGASMPETIRYPGYGDQAQAASVEDHRRWLGFLDDIS